jgi:hypothetical protein
VNLPPQPQPHRSRVGIVDRPPDADDQVVTCADLLVTPGRPHAVAVIAQVLRRYRVEQLIKCENNRADRPRLLHRLHVDDLKACL